MYLGVKVFIKNYKSLNSVVSKDSVKWPGDLTVYYNQR